MILLLRSLSWYKGEADPSSTLSGACSCSSTFRLAPSASRAYSSAFSSKSSSSSSDINLSSSTRHASSSASTYICSSSSDLGLAARARQTPSSTFKRTRLCSCAFCLASLSTRAYLSSPNWSWSSSLAFSLASSMRRASYSNSSHVCSSYSSALCLPSRDRCTPYSTFIRAHLCYSAMVMGIDVCVSWKCIVLWHSANWHNRSSNST